MQIDFRQKSFFLHSPCTPRYHAFISIRCLTLRIPPSSILLIQRSSFYTLDHLWLFRGSALLSDLSRYLKKRNKRYGIRGLELTSLLALNRTNYPPSLPAPSILFLTAFLSLIRYSILLNEAIVPSFLPLWRPHLQPLALPSTIHARIRPFLWESIYPIFFNLPLLLFATGTIRQKRLPLFSDDVLFVRDIVLFRVSNFKRYYSSFRKTPSRILDFHRRIFPVRRTPGYIILLFLLPFDFLVVTWDSATRWFCFSQGKRKVGTTMEWLRWPRENGKCRRWTKVRKEFSSYFQKRSKCILMR